jgi:hypothetical protein
MEKKVKMCRSTDATMQFMPKECSSLLFVCTLRDIKDKIFGLILPFIGMLYI